MAEESSTEGTEPVAPNAAAEVAAEALAAMRDDERAATLSDALEKAWDGAYFDVDAAIAAITRPQTAQSPS